MQNHINSIAKSALAKANRIQSGETTTTDARVSPMAQSLGITFDSNNNVNTNQTNDDISDLQARLTALENRLLNYESHTHTYEDDTIADTSDGSGATSTATKHTSGIDT